MALYVILRVDCKPFSMVQFCICVNHISCYMCVHCEAKKCTMVVTARCAGPMYFKT